MNSPAIPSRVVSSAECSSASPAAISREFQDLIRSGLELVVSGRAKKRPKQLLERGYTPKHRVDLFGHRIYLSNSRQNPELRFYVAFIVPEPRSGPPRRAYARILYKDLSLVWRAASHMAYDEDGSLWVGKGDTRTFRRGGYEFVESLESTTDLPYEIQDALESRLKAIGRVLTDDKVLELVLRTSSASRIAPYADFLGPRRKAAANPENRINGGRTIGRFRRAGDPTSLEIVAGFEPDFRRGVLETTESHSRIYGGKLRRFRILSSNRKIQYLFIAGPDQVWVIPPQALTTAISTFGVRTIDVVADPDLFVSGWEYHYLDTDFDPPEMYSQIPEGFAGRVCPYDEQKADASPWLDQLPIVQKFRRQVLGQKSGKSNR